MSPPRAFRLRLLLFLYSNANIAGCALALLGPLLLFAGVIGPGWLAITAGLYAAGWLLGRRPPALEADLADGLDADETLARLDRLIARVRPHLQLEAARHLDSVRASVAEVLPRLVGASHHDADLFTVHETVLRYLPETLANYVALPPVFRISHPLQDGRTARQLLGEQLSLLDAKLREIVNNVAASDAQALLANGRFLEDKFRRVDFLGA
ncbi:hypothetical protein [Plasticicumulans acidivorans]|uniref:5-bromo-4-chloroindolyl phosphate hydrolysis protein n=1 Tax=Plasticicumulans acidivorans TaxID=886464 RepID=A0A317MZD2_9GAMM|nr:hypothetical protein [Plasticicumulans acidivorans]PWV65671.1 hypothetical protein C7443_101155 [Plasticicumulans acidivorans]